MTKKEFLTKHGDFQIDQEKQVLIHEFANSKDHTLDYEPIFFIESIAYNHGFVLENLDNFETDWNQLEQDLLLSKKLEEMLQDCYYSSESDYPYSSFVLANFKNNDSFLISFFKSLGLTFLNQGEDTFKNPAFLSIKVEEINNSNSVLMMNEPYEDYYEDINRYKEADQLFHQNLKNIKRISMNHSYEFNGAMPIFFIGETYGNNVIGVFSVGIFT